MLSGLVACATSGNAKFASSDSSLMSIFLLFESSSPAPFQACRMKQRLLQRCTCRREYTGLVNLTNQTADRAGSTTVRDRSVSSASSSQQRPIPVAATRDRIRFRLHVHDRVSQLIVREGSPRELQRLRRGNLPSWEMFWGRIDRRDLVRVAERNRG